ASSRHVSAVPMSSHYHLAPRRTLPCQLLALAQVDLVGEHREVSQFGLGKAREQRHVADQVDLLVMAESHTPSLEWCRLPGQTGRAHRSYPAVVRRFSSSKRRFFREP